MKIRIWNAFASNNSGSYTIVGSFRTIETAQAAEVELKKLMETHDHWLSAFDATTYLGGPSPLDDFVNKHGLQSGAGAPNDDSWPQFAYDNVPQVIAVGNQIIIHHNYTVTLPRLFGEYFYKLGGRVVHEINHAHHPLVSVFRLFVPWQEREKVNAAVQTKLALERLNAADGPLILHIKKDAPKPAWQTSEDWDEPALMVGAIFEDLIAGFAAVQDIARACQLTVHVSIFEPFNDSDPLAFLRTQVQ